MNNNPDYKTLAKELKRVCRQTKDGWKVCMQDSSGYRQYECLKCHYVTKWVKGRSELAMAKKHACPSPIDRDFDDLGDL
jgi:hypothetical protein